MKLLVSLQSFQGGNIYINEVPITEIDVDNLRQTIIYIPQHPKLFNRTLRENLTYGLPPEITAEHILKFMKENGFIELEEIFRKRMDEKVGKGGQNFSGGQKGTIWFLRAAMQNANLIIADEPTSALDPQSKAQIKKMIDIIAKKKANREYYQHLPYSITGLFVHYFVKGIEEDFNRTFTKKSRNKNK